MAETQKQPNKPTTKASALLEKEVKDALAGTFVISIIGETNEAIATEEKKLFNDTVALLWETEDPVIRRILQVVAQNIQAQGFRTKFITPSGPFLKKSEVHSYLREEQGVSSIDERVRRCTEFEANLVAEFKNSHAEGLCSSFLILYGDPRRLIFISTENVKRKKFSVEELAATIIHEYTHFVLGVVYGNFYEPYPMEGKGNPMRMRNFLDFFESNQLKDPAPGALSKSYDNIILQLETGEELFQTDAGVVYGPPLAVAFKTCLMSWKEMFGFGGSQLVGVRDVTRPQKEMLPYFIEMRFHVAKYGSKVMPWLEYHIPASAPLFRYFTDYLYPDLDGELLTYS